MSAESVPHSPKTAFATTEPLMTLTTQKYTKKDNGKTKMFMVEYHTHTHTTNI